MPSLLKDLKKHELHFFFFEVVEKKIAKKGPTAKPTSFSYFLGLQKHEVQYPQYASHA